MHPPFSDYTDLHEFMECYRVFEDSIKESFVETEILIENRSGSRYSGGVFILTTIEDLVKLSQEIDKSGSNLRITLDIPQLFTTHDVSINKPDLMIELFEQVASTRHNIRGIHLWGKKK